MAGISTWRATRRQLLIAGGAGAGLIVAWSVWPRAESVDLLAAPGEHVLNGFVKVGIDGHVTIVVPQVEMGQGVSTTLPQIVADELGADWRTIGVETASAGPFYVNDLYAREAFDTGFTTRRAGAVMVTGGSTSVRGYEARLREAGAAARALLCLAAAARWDADWRACDTAQGFVVRGDDKVRFGELAAEAAALQVPDDVPLRSGRENRLTEQSLPRLDLPSKVDGTVNYAGDIRLPDMVYASIAQGPLGDTRLVSINRGAAEKLTGLLSIVETDRWVAAVATNWWSANQAIALLRPTFSTQGPLASDSQVKDALVDAFDAGIRVAEAGDVGAIFRGHTIVTAEYRIGLAAHAAIEPMTATAHLSDGHLQLWIGTQVPELAAKAAADAIGMAADAVTVHPMMIGGSFGRRMEIEIAAQVAVLAGRLKRPVQLVWARSEDLRQDRFRPAAAARMSAKLDQAGRVEGWLAKIAVPATPAEVEARVWDGARANDAMQAKQGVGSAAAVAGAIPPYTFANFAIDHHPAAIGVPTGDWRGRSHGLASFFTECFVDELAAVSGIDPFSFRMAALAENPRLALCLSKAAATGGWEGGGAGTGQGLACHMMAGSNVAVFAEADIGPDGRVRVSRLVAVVDCGRVINPDVVKQQIAGGMMFGMASATGAAINVVRGLAEPTRFGQLKLPRMSDAPRIEIELLNSPYPPGGVGEIAVPPTAPAIANALYAATGRRFRTLPLVQA